jgi:hypothetical protein
MAVSGHLVRAKTKLGAYGASFGQLASSKSLRPNPVAEDGKDECIRKQSPCEEQAFEIELIFG